jgi:hypothetical protein
MNVLEVRSHSIQARQRAKSREGDKQIAAKSTGSPSALAAGHAKENDVSAASRNETRELRVGDSVSVAEAEEAVKKIFLITGNGIAQRAVV